MNKKALITGITGQDGSYLAELLLEKGYDVHGIVRRTAIENQDKRFSRIRHIMDDITFHSATLESYGSLHKAIEETRPNELYHLAAQTFVATSFEDELSTLNTNINGTHYILQCVKLLVPDCKVYFAGSSEMFGKVYQSPQDENTPFYPRSPYGISKVTGFNLTRYYREAWKIFACCGILFNHEGKRRGMEFVTRKITHTAAQIKQHKVDELRVGNLDALRDWGNAKDYVKAMYLMLQQDKPDDFVVATGQTHSVKDFIKSAFGYLELDWEKYVVVDPKFYRPNEVHTLCGNATKAKDILGWKPTTYFDDLVKEMVDHDMIQVAWEA